MPRTSTVDRSFLEAALVGFRHRLGEITLTIDELKRRLGGPAASADAAPTRQRRKRKAMCGSAETAGVGGKEAVGGSKESWKKPARLIGCAVAVSRSIVSFKP